MDLPNLVQPVECEVTIAGLGLGDLTAAIEEVRVEMRRGAATTCTLVIDSIRTEAGSWTVQDKHPYIRPMAEIQLVARFGSTRIPVMSGLIADVHLEFPQEMSGAKVTVTAQDYTLLLDRERLDKNLSQADAPKSDGAIARELADQYHLDAEVEDGLTPKSLRIADTAIKFLKTRAAANGFELYARDKVLHFHGPRLGGEPQPPILVYAGRSTNCIRLAVNHDGHQPDQVSVTFASDKSAEVLEHRAVSQLKPLGSEPAAFTPVGASASVWRLDSPNGADAQELKARAQAQANERALCVTAEGELDGAVYRAVLRNYETVTVDGAGSKYSGRYYVADVLHSFKAGEYRQQFKLLRNALGDDRAADTLSTDRIADARAR